MKHAYSISALAFAIAAPADAQGDVAAMWKDAAFQKAFVAGYGVNAEVEPRVTSSEVAILEKIRPLMADNLPEAQTALEKHVKPESSAILDFTLGGILFQQDKVGQALQRYLAAVGKFPSFRRAWRNLGLIRVRMGSYDEAIAAFTKMVELGGGDGYSYGLLGFAYASKQDYQPAEAAYRNALLLQPDNTEWRLGLTRCVFKQEKFQDAATLLDALLARYPDKGEFWQLQAQAYLGMKAPLKAAEDLEILDRLGKSTVESLHKLGDIYLSEGLPDLAAGAYGRSIDVDAGQSLARPLRSAELLAARGAAPQSRAVVDRIRARLDTAADDAARRKLLKLEARLCIAEGKDGGETVKVLEEIVALDPLDGEALLLLGQHHARQNQPDRAMFYYERAESLEAFEVNARIRHAQILVGMGRLGEAVPLLRRAHELKPRDDVARYLEQVERLARARK